VDIFADDFVEHIFNTFHTGLANFPQFDVFMEIINTLLGGKTVPDAIAGNHNKFILRCKRDLLYLRYARYHLGFNWQFFIEFVFEIAQGPRKRKNTTHTAFFNEAASSLNALKLSRVVRLVVLGHLQSLNSSGHHTTTVARVSTNNIVFCNQGHTGSAASLKYVVFDGVFALIVVHQIVHLYEALFQSFFIVTVFVLRQLFENFDEFLLRIKCNFFTSMAVKNAENRLTVGQFDLGNVRILLLVAPTLHTAAGKLQFVV